MSALEIESLKETLDTLFVQVHEHIASASVGTTSNEKGSAQKAAQNTLKKIKAAINDYAATLKRLQGHAQCEKWNTALEKRKQDLKEAETALTEAVRSATGAQGHEDRVLGHGTQSTKATLATASRVQADALHSLKRSEALMAQSEQTGITVMRKL